MVTRLRLAAHRLEHQAKHTSPLRLPLYRAAKIASARRVLDVGCGNGLITNDLARLSRGHVVGIDQDPHMVAAAEQNLARRRNSRILLGRAEALPFEDGEFDLVVCNLLLMWVRDPGRVVKEMARVTNRKGRVLASMEPDYGGKIHWPESPIVDQIFQGEMIRRKGGDPHAGRKLRQWFVGAGLRTTVGLSNPSIPSCADDLEGYHYERGFYRKALLQGGLSDAQIDGWEHDYVQSLKEEVQLNYLPLFYALGTKT